MASFKNSKNPLSIKHKTIATYLMPKDEVKKLKAIILRTGKFRGTDEKSIAAKKEFDEYYEDLAKNKPEYIRGTAEFNANKKANYKKAHPKKVKELKQVAIKNDLLSKEEIVAILKDLSNTKLANDAAYILSADLDKMLYRVEDPETKGRVINDVADYILSHPDNANIYIAEIKDNKYAKGGETDKKGRGLFGLQKGKAISTTDKLSVGDIILKINDNTENVVKIIDVRTSPELIYDAVWWDPIANESRWPDVFSIRPSGFEDYYFPRQGLKKIAKTNSYDKLYVIVQESKDGFWTIASKPSYKHLLKESFQDQKENPPKGETVKMVTLEEAKKHEKVIGEEYLTDEMIVTKRPKKFSKGGSVSRIDSMLESWNKEGRAWSNINNDDSGFFEKIGLPMENVGITSQTGNDVMYYNVELYDSDSDAIKSKKITQVSPRKFAKGGSVENNALNKGDEESRPKRKVIGKTTSGKDVWSDSEPESTYYLNFSKEDHQDASDLHEKERKKLIGNSALQQHHNNHSYDHESKVERMKHLEIPEYQEGGENKIVNENDGLKHALLEFVSSGTIAGMTGIDKYSDVDGIRLTAVQMLNRDGDKPYSLESLKSLLQEAKNEWFENKYESKFANGGEIRDEHAEFKSMIGKEIEVYQLGDNNHENEYIKTISTSPQSYSHRSITINTDKNTYQFPFEDYKKFKNEGVEIKTGSFGDTYLIKVIDESKYAKGGKTSNFNWYDFSLSEFNSYLKSFSQDISLDSVLDGEYQEGKNRYVPSWPSKLKNNRFSIGVDGKAIVITAGHENLYSSLQVYDIETNKEYVLRLYSKDGKEPMKELIHGVIKQFKEGGEISESKSELIPEVKFGDSPFFVAYNIPEGLIFESLRSLNVFELKWLGGQFQECNPSTFKVNGKKWQECQEINEQLRFNGYNLRSVKVNYSNGDSITTSMAANLTDEQITDFFAVGKTFNIGSGENDNMQTIESVEILK